MPSLGEANAVKVEATDGRAHNLDGVSEPYNGGARHARFFDCDFAAIVVSISISSRNEPGNAGLHNGIKPDPQLDAFVNLPHGAFGKGGDVKVLLDPAGCL